MYAYGMPRDPGRRGIVLSKAKRLFIENDDTGMQCRNQSILDRSMCGAPDPILELNDNLFPNTDPVASSEPKAGRELVLDNVCRTITFTGACNCVPGHVSALLQ